MMNLSNKVYIIHYVWRRILTATILRSLFAQIGRGSVVYKPGLLSGADFISIGCRSIIRYGARIEVINHGQAWMPSISIGDDVNIEQIVHIICHDRIKIGNRVSISGHCSIVDVSHPSYFKSDTDKMGQIVNMERSFVEIGEGSFIGFGANILPNVRIGRMCVIGAGAVVTRNIPDYAIAAGIPARIVGTTKGKLC